MGIYRGKGTFNCAIKVDMLLNHPSTDIWIQLDFLLSIGACQTTPKLNDLEKEQFIISCISVAFLDRYNASFAFYHTSDCIHLRHSSSESSGKSQECIC